MATFNRLTGSALSLTINSAEYMAQISSWEISEEEKDKDIVTFASASAAQQKLKVSLLQSLNADSLHQVLFDNPGKKDVDFKLAPTGDLTAKADNPVYIGKLNFPKLRPTIGMEAKSEGATTEVEFDIVEFKKNTGEH